MNLCVRSSSRFVQSTQRFAVQYRLCTNVVKDVGPPEDPVTHTGQHWDKEDYRLVRFMENPKQVEQQMVSKHKHRFEEALAQRAPQRQHKCESLKVNPNFAVKLIAEVPPKAVSARTTWCDGGNGALGHPRVFINLDAPGNHTCGYCGLRFYQDHSSKGH